MEKILEIWKAVIGYEGHYEVSNLGNVRSIKREKTILKGDFQANGYRRVYLWKDGRKKNHLVHRLVAMAFIENPKKYTDINHKDENKQNNRVSNLEWCSHQYNMRYGNVREKISKANLGRKPSLRVRKILSQNSRDRCWLNKDGVEKFIKQDDIFNFLNDGWQKGRLKRRIVE